MSERARQAVLGLACLAALAAAPVVSAAPAGGAPCVVADTSATATDRASYCAGYSGTYPTRLLLFSVSRDGGRSWTTKTSAGVPNDVMLTQLVAARRTPDDRTVFLQTTGGLFATSDDGATFLLVDPLGRTSSGTLSLSKLGPTGVGAADTELVRLAWANPSGRSAIITPPLHVPAGGTPDRDHRFLVPDPGPGPYGTEPLALAVQVDTVGVRSRVTAYRCTAALSCVDPLYVFPYGLTFRGAVLAPDFAATGTAYVWLSDHKTHDTSVWVTRDGGASFTRWAATDPLLRGANLAGESAPDVTISVRPGRSREIYLRVVHQPVVSGKTGVPEDQIFRSEDGGRRWLRVAHTSWKGARTLPWNTQVIGALPYVSYVAVQADGRVFALGNELGTYEGIYCSVDGGRRWARACAR